jgi:O-antigen/teichoic acid export membrane protein
MVMSDLHASIRKSGMWMIARWGITLTVGALVTTYIIRSLTIKDFGIYTLLYSMIGYISVISSSGISSIFRRFIPEAFQRKEY